MAKWHQMRIISHIFPFKWEFAGGGFASDCVLHHPVSLLLKLDCAPNFYPDISKVCGVLGAPVLAWRTCLRRQFENSGKNSPRGHFSGQTMGENAQKWRVCGSESLTPDSPKGDAVRSNRWEAEKDALVAERSVQLAGGLWQCSR